MGRYAVTRCLTPLLLGLLALPAVAQEPPTADLQGQVEQMQETLRAIQKDIAEIKGMLASRGPRPSGLGAVIDTAGSAVKGESTAKLTMLEFSDYQ